MLHLYSLSFFLNFFCLNSCNSLRNYINLTEYDYKHLLIRINSIIHANLIVLIGILFIIGFIDDSTWMLCLDITRGYCLYDTLMILYFTPKDFTMIIHHLMLFFGTYSHFISIYPIQAAIGLLSESSNQHLHFGWYMIKTKKTKSLLFKVNAAFLLLLFLFFRVINFTYLFLFACLNCSYIEPCLILPIMSMNYYWFYLLCQKAISM